MRRIRHAIPILFAASFVCAGVYLFLVGSGFKPEKAEPIEAIGVHRSAVESQPAVALTEPAAASRVSVSGKGASSDSSGMAQGLVIEGNVLGNLADALDRLAVYLIAEDVPQSKRIQLGRAIDLATARFEIRAPPEILNEYLGNRAFRVELIEGRRVLDVKVLEKVNAETVRTRKSKTDLLVRQDVTFVAPSIVTGRVVDARNLPIREATADLLTGSKPANLVWVPASSRRTLEDGSFRLAVRDATSGTLLISHPNFEIKSMRLQLLEGTVLDLGVIQLNAGFEIAGVLRCPYAIYPLGGTRIVAYPQLHREKEYVPNGMFSVGGLALQQMDTDLVRERFQTDCDEFGNFVIRGVRQGLHRIDWTSPWTPRMDTARNASRKQETVVAPASGIIIDIDEPLVVGFVTCDDKPIKDASVSVHPFTMGIHHLRTDSSGRCYYFGRPGQRFYMAAHAPGFARAVVDVKAPGDREFSEIHLPLKRIQSPASLILKVMDPMGRPIPEVACAIVPAHSNLVTAAWVRMKADENGQYEFGDLDPEPHHVEVRSWRWNESNRPFIPARFDVDLEPDSKVHREVKFELGGQITVQVEDDRTEAKVLARCSLWSEGGDQIATGFHHPDGVWSGSPILPPPVPEGTYTVIAEHPDYEAAQATVKVEKGKRALVKLKMKRK